MTTLNIVGAGLAGLSAAVAALPHWKRVRVFEAAPQAGGRCRSYYDTTLNCRIDNGNHLILGAYEATLVYARAIGALDTFYKVAPAAIAFAEPQSGLSWILKPDRGPIPFSLFFKDRRVPETGIFDLIRDIKKLRKADINKTVSETLNPTSKLFRRLWVPMTLGILNTPPNEASAQLLWSALSKTLTKGEKSCRPYLPKEGLSESLIDPAIEKIENIKFNTPLKDLKNENGRIVGLNFGKETVPLDQKDAVILALPPKQTSKFIPDLEPPKGANTILNIHFRLQAEARIKGGAPFLGLVGTLTQWLFTRGHIASVTVSAANAIDNDNIAPKVWAEIAPYLEEDDSTVPRHRIIREKRATFHQSPLNANHRPGTATAFSNLFLAGDWTATELPATIEGAILSGQWAEEAARNRFLI